MAQKLSKTQEEQALARAQRQELKQELAEQYAQRPRNVTYQRRRITFLVLGVIGVLAVVFSVLVLWPAPTLQPLGGIPVGTAAPQFHLPVYGGGGIGSSIDLHTLQGHPVILNFWSESCLPCRAEVPYLQRVFLRDATQGQFALVGINQADPKDDIRTFGNTFHVTYPLLFDAGNTINSQYNVTAIPTTYFIDSKGIVRSVFVQPLTPDTMKQGLASVGVSL
jgi:cytochrome c biogenesis protein CcmG/thiol:disulfide interchange protein DsbE